MLCRICPRFVFAINLIGLALTLACASTLFTSDSHVLGSIQVTSSLLRCHGAGTSSLTYHQHVQNSAGSKPGLVVYAEHSITSDFICLLGNTGWRVHLLSKIHKLSLYSGEVWFCWVPVCIGKSCLEEHSGSDCTNCAGFLTAWRGELSPHCL